MKFDSPHIYIDSIYIIIAMPAGIAILLHTTTLDPVIYAQRSISNLR